MDGRDIGTVIMPKAELKVYVDADINERAKRRYNDFVEQGINTNLEMVKNDLIRRDESDKNRTASPLKRALDARILDTTRISIEDGVTQILLWVKESLDKVTAKR